MTLRIHAPNPIRVGETGNVLVTSDNPGVVSLTYGAGLTGPSSVTIEGARVWRNGLKHGQYLARANCLQARDTFALFLEIDTDDIPVSNVATTGAYANMGVIGSLRSNAARRINWIIQIMQTYYINNAMPLFVWRYIQSNTSTSTESVLVSSPHYYTQSTSIRLIVTCEGTAVNFYWTTGTSADSAHQTGRTTPTGTMGVGEFFFIAVPGKFAKLEGTLPSQADREAFMSSGALPSGLAASYQGGHEIVESAPRFWDTSGNNLDLSDVDVPYWPVTAASGDYTDDPLNPVVPYAIVPVTAVATTGTTIDATRPRQGVPARASAAEKTESADQVTVTVEAPLVSIGPDTDATVEAYPADVYLQVCATPDGVVSLASDDPNLTVPATVEVSGGSATVTCTASADVTGATVTATYGDTTDTASVTVTEAAAPAETLVIGPDVTVSVDSYPAVIKLLVTSNTDGEVTVESDDTNIIPDSPVNVVSGEAEMDCLVIADVMGATLTASRLSGVSDTCTVTTTEAVATIKIGPSQTVRRGSTTVSVHITGEDGTVSLTSAPHGLDCPATATISSGEVDVSIPIMSAGTYTITATDDTGSDTAVVVVPGNYQATEDYDLVQDIADVIEDMIPAAGNAYHYDEIVIDDDGRLDAEDHVFGVRVIGTIEGPIVGGKTIMAEVAVASFPQVSPAEVEALQNYLSQEADWPAYVGAVVCNQVQVNALNGGDIVIYQLEVILG
jgi:hypothetical protein